MHGDLTTRNILLNKTHTVAKIGDLGLSKTLQASITEVNHGGTLAFAAPEVLLNMRCNEKVPSASCADADGPGAHAVCRHARSRCHHHGVLDFASHLCFVYGNHRILPSGREEVLLLLILVLVERCWVLRVRCLLLTDRGLAQADMFSFGVVLWTLCTQEVPLRGHLRRLQAGLPSFLHCGWLMDACCDHLSSTMLEVLRSGASQCVVDAGSALAAKML